MPRITACSTLAFSLSTLEVALEHIAAYGLAQVEIAEMLTHSKHFPIDTVNPAAVKTLLEKYALHPVAANVTMATYHSAQPELLEAPIRTQSSAETDDILKAKRQRVYYRLHVPNEARLYAARLHTLIDKAQSAGIPMLVISVGRKEHADDIERAIAATAELLDEQAEYARRAGVKLLLEMPHVWQIYHDVQRSKQLLSHLQSDNIGVVIDSTHWHVSGYDIDDYVSCLADRLWHVHLRDAAGQESSAQDYRLEKTPGRGEVDFPLLAGTLDRYNFAGTVTLETEYKNYQDPAEVDSENAYALDYLARSGWEVTRHA